MPRYKVQVGPNQFRMVSEKPPAGTVVANQSERFALPCLHEGDITERCPKGDELKHVRECGLHDVNCTRGESKIRNCADCRDYRPEHWPTEFAAEFHAELDRTRSVPYPEGRYAGRGMVICGGGWKSLPGIYVAARFMRWEHVNSHLPIEVWYIGDRGEFDPIFAHITEGLNVTWRDASAEARKLGLWPRKEELRGWAIKPLALMLSSFEQVVMIDQDCYPAYDPERLWDDPRIASKPAAFWPDNQAHICGKPLTEEQWGFFGLRKPTKTIPGFESGQMVVDKRRSWHAVQMCAFLSDRFNEFDRTRGKVNGHHGDKDAFAVAWHATGTPFSMAPATKHHEVAYLQHDPDGQVAFVHRCNDKPRIDFQELKNTTQKFEHGQFRSATLHHEHMFHDFLKRLSRTLRPPIPGFRDGTQDQQIWNEIHILNVYRLPKRMDEMRVLDIGAHAGFFALECLKRGAERVVCVEPFRPNLDQLRMNLAAWSAKAEIVEAAIAGQDGETHIRGSLHGDGYTGEPHVAPDGMPVAAVTLDSLIERLGHIDLLKLDCEGGEYPAILGATKLAAVGRVSLEWHSHKECEGTPQQLCEKLRAEGFAVEMSGEGCGIGMIHATRQ